MITALPFRISTLLLRIFSRIPLNVLYLFSGILYFILYAVIGYRKKIVLDNLKRSFPEYSADKINAIAKAFYHYFSELIVENIKMLDLSSEALEKRVSLKNPEILENYYRHNKSVIAIAAHYCNWEWILGISKKIQHTPVAVYKPLNDTNFDRFLTQMRSGFGSHLITMREVPRYMTKTVQEGELVTAAFIADQSPVWEEIQYWTPFLNQKTPVYLGPEKIARRFGMAVIQFYMKRVKRGHYEIELIPITDDASTVDEYYITEKHISNLEQFIRNEPEYWLWSHRRWKLTRKREKEEKDGRFKFNGQFRKTTLHQ